MLAYHPRLHPDLGPAVVTLDFMDGDRKRFVEVKFDDMPDVTRAAKTNVFESRGPLPVA